jgi:hypothetical protein
MGLAALLYTKGIARRLAAPDAWTYALFVQSGRKPAQLKLIHLNGVEYFVWLGRTSSTAIMLRFGSGPPIYVFDSRGTLVGWSPTTGDGEYDVFLGSEWRAGEPLSADEALRRIQSRTGAAAP